METEGASKFAADDSEQKNSENVASVEKKTDVENVKNDCVYNENKSDVPKDESGAVDDEDPKNTTVEYKEQRIIAFKIYEDSLPAGDELALGATGSDSGVEGCGRALSSGGGSQSCASSVVSCGSGCGSESSSLAGAPLRTRRRVNVSATDPKRNSPISTSTPRPVTAPRGPSLATRERARSREKPTPPEKPRPLTPKPRIRPTTDLPNIVRESPALRAKPTKTSTARCRVPSSPMEDKRWPLNAIRLTASSEANATRVAADKYGTLPRRRRDEGESSPRFESTPLTSRRPAITRSTSARSSTKGRVKIYAEKTTQTVLLGSDIEDALAGILPNIETHREVTKCHRAVQVNARDAEMARLTNLAAAAQASAVEERQRRENLEAQLTQERRTRQSAIAELERNSQRLLELAGAGADAGADSCLKALEEQLKSARELSSRQRAEIDLLRLENDKQHNEVCILREKARVLEARLVEAEREGAEMQEFLAAETGALGTSLRDAEEENERITAARDRSRLECRQLVRVCEQRQQEIRALTARMQSIPHAERMLDRLAARVGYLSDAVSYATQQPSNEEPRDVERRSNGFLSALGQALRSSMTRTNSQCPGTSQRFRPNTLHLQDDERSRLSEDNDNSADLLDSETEPCLVTDPDCAEEWWSGAEGAGAWSGEELSPERELVRGMERCGVVAERGGDTPGSASLSERDSLRDLSAAIVNRQRSEAEHSGYDSLADRIAAVDLGVVELIGALLMVTEAAVASDEHPHREEPEASREEPETCREAAETSSETRAEAVERYRETIETLRQQISPFTEQNDLEVIEQEVRSWAESERVSRQEAIETALGALMHRDLVLWPRTDAPRRALQRLLHALAVTSTTQPPSINDSIKPSVAPLPSTA